MVFWSTYKSSRVLGKDFMIGPIMRLRSVGEYIFQRPWAGSFHLFHWGDGRIYLVCVPIVFWIHKQHNNRQLDGDFDTRAVIGRWGGTIEEVRKNLSAADQLRARAYFQWERTLGIMASNDVRGAPPGCPLPGPELYSKGHAHGHH